MLNLKALAMTMAVSMSLAPGVGSASAYGFLGNFDVVNDTGFTAHGFEIELEGLHSSDITDTFGGEGRGFPSGRGFDPLTSVQRYGAPSITEYSDGSTFGTRVTYLGVFDFNTHTWDYGTPSGSFITPGDNCWSGGGVGYGPSTPCDHFGVGTTRNPTKTTYSWLLETATPGVLSKGVVTLPAPAWEVTPSPVVGNAPIIVAAIQAPQPENNIEFGEAVWVKVFTTELEDAVELEELVGGNQKVEQAVTEVEWQLLQRDAGNPDSGRLESGYGVPVGPNAASILRRYEFYAYAGEYDPETHEAKPTFSDSHPNDPNDPLYYDPSKIVDLGNYLGAQNAAVNLAPVPEPHTYAMLLAGLGVVGAAVRRRHGRANPS